MVISKEEFKVKIVNALKKEVDPTEIIEVREVMKNNGIMWDGLMIHSDQSKIAPTIYLNHYYDEYVRGRTLADIVREIRRLCSDHKIGDDSVVDFFMEYEQVRPQLGYRLINKARNREFLRDVPHLDFLDLAVVFYCMVDTEVLSGGSIVIHNHHLKMWNISKDRLAEDAYTNAQEKLPIICQSMSEILREMVGAQDMLEQEEFLELNRMSDSLENAMYVLSNKRKVHGASVLLYSNLKEHLPHADTDYYILPSSIHEVILVPVTEETTPDELHRMVQEVNTTQLEPEDVLSDSVYYYSYEENRVSVVR